MNWSRVVCLISSVLFLVTVNVQARDEAKGLDSDTKARLTRAGDLVGALSKEDYKKASEHFDPMLVKGLGKEGIGPVWKKLLTAIGPMKKYGMPRASGTAVLVACEFDKSKLDLRVTFSKDNKITGFTFVPGKDTYAFAPPPYAKQSELREVALTINQGGEWPLPATLTLPKGDGPFPAVILVHGSGPNDRDETVGPNKPFRDIAWGLAMKGIATLRYVKRTREHGKKMVEKGKITPKEEVIDDALAALTLLRKTDKIDPERVFLLGHSLGGYIGPKIAAADQKLAGLIILAGNTRPLEDLVVAQYTYLFGLGGEISEENKKTLKEIREKSQRVKDPKLTAETPAKELALGLDAVYWLALRGYDPGATTANLKAAVLVLQGERDYQITMEDLAGWKKALKDKKNATFKSYPTLNHLFMEGEGKGKSKPEEYYREGHVAKPVIDDIAAFIKK